MTRPIFEPNEQRQVAALGFGSNQLFRRPAPTVPSELEWGTASFTTDQTVTSGVGAFLTVAWDTVTIGADQSVILQGASSTQPFKIVQDDAVMVAVWAWVQFTDVSWTDWRALEITLSRQPNAESPNPVMPMKHGEGVNTGSRIEGGASPLRVAGALTGGFDGWSLNVWQTSGLDKTVTQGGYQIALLGTAA